MVVDADHRQVARHREPELARGEDAADRHLVGGGEDRGGPVGGVGEQLHRGRVPAGDGEVGAAVAVEVGRVPGIAQRGLESEPALRGRVELEVPLLTAADVGDAAVPQPDEMVGGETAHRDVIDRDRARAGQRAADARDGLAEREQTADLVLVEGERDGDDRIHPVAQEVVVEHAAALAVVPAQVVEREVVAAAQEGALGSLDHGREEPAVQVGDDDADVAGAARGEAGGVRRDDVADRGRHLGDARAGAVRDGAVAAERTGDRCGRDSGETGDVVDAGHRTPSAVV